MKHTFLTILIALVLLLSGGDVYALAPAIADDADAGAGFRTTTPAAMVVEKGLPYTSLAEALKAGAGLTVRLLRTIDLTDVSYKDLPIANGTVIDLSGNQLYSNAESYMFEIADGTSVTIVDSSTGGTGKITAKQHSPILLCGKLTISNGYFCNGNSGEDISKSDIVSMNEGACLVVNSGTFDSQLCTKTSGTTVDITGGKFKSNPEAFLGSGYYADKSQVETEGYYYVKRLIANITYADGTTQKVGTWLDDFATIDLLDNVGQISAQKWASKVEVPADVDGVNVKLVRYFSTDMLYPFYVPFEIKSIPDGVKIATITGAETKDDKTSILYQWVKDGETIPAYTPCIMKPINPAAPTVLEFNDVNFRASTGTAEPVSVGTDQLMFAFHGVLENTLLNPVHGWYLDAYKHGAFMYDFDDTAYLTPFKFYLIIYDKKSGGYIVPSGTLTQQIAMHSVEDDEPTGISDINATQRAADSRVCNLQGAVVGTSLEGLPAGVYVKQGRKVVVK